MISSVKVPKKNRLEFVIKGVDISIINAIRRIGISEIPNVALDIDVSKAEHEDAIVHKNTTPLSNEYLLHRMSLIPFCFSEEEIETFDSSKFKFRLAVKNNHSTDSKSVTTKDIEITGHPSTLKARVFPAHPITGDHILITKLKPGEELDIEFSIKKGIGKTHARWCPVSQCTFSYQEDKEDIYQFKIESDCAMTPKYIFNKSIQVLKEKVKTFKDVHIKEKTNIVKLAEGFYDITIKDEDSTLAHVLQSCIYNYCIKNGKNKNLTYIAYYQSHPLNKFINLKLKYEGNDLLEMFDANCNQIIKDLEVFSSDFSNAVK